MKDNYSLGEIELLSCCLDDELSPAEKNKLQKRLGSDPGLQKKYSQLQRTRTILRNTPKRKVPRNFTLPSESMKPVLRNPSFVSVLRFSSVIAAVGLVFLLALEFLPLIQPRRTGQLSDTTELMAAAPAAKSVDAPMIITWGAPLDINAYGLGGGGGSDASPLTSYVIPRETSAEDMIPMEIQPVEPPVVTLEDPLKESAQQQPRESTSIELTGSQPLLGVRPLQERGKIEFPNQSVDYVAENEGLTPLRISQIILGAVAIFFTFISFLMQRKKKTASKD